MRFNKASSKVTKIANLLIKEHFPELKHIKILYCFRAKPKNAPDGMITAGEARVLPAKLQDLWGYNAEIELAKPVWVAMSDSQKRRLLWHELRHLRVEMEEDEPVHDKEDRVSCYCDPHDLIMKTFSEELRIFGLQKNDIKILRTLHRIYLEYKAGKIKKIKTLKVDDLEVDMG